MKNTVLKEKFFDNSIIEVWHAITDQEAISQWLIKADFKPEVGYGLKFTHEPSSTVVTGTVLEVIPPCLLVYTWIVGATQTVTTVKWQLKEHGKGTLVVLEHTGFEDYKESAAEMFKSTSKGWDACLVELVKYLKRVVRK